MRDDGGESHSNSTKPDTDELKMSNVNKLNNNWACFTHVKSGK